MPEVLNLLLRRERLPFKQSKQAAWSKVEERLNETSVIEMNHSRSPMILRLAAALVFLVVSASAVVYFAGKADVSNMTGAIAEHTLPDGSAVILNQQASLEYNKWMFQLDRSVNLQGEGFFEVEKGGDFRVYTTEGVVRVLGTSFNVNSENGAFDVQCKTGKVAVHIAKVGVYTLVPGDRISSVEGEVKKTRINPESIAAWSTPYYQFEDASVAEVFERLSNDTGYQFDIKVDVDLRYTGQFDANLNIDRIMEIVCKPMGLDFMIDHKAKVITILNK